MEEFSCLIKRVEAKGDIHGIIVCRGTPFLTHLLFVDACFLFCRESKNEVKALSSVLQNFERASSQAIGIPPKMTKFISSYLGVIECLDPGKYLGLPFISGIKRRLS